MLNNLRVCLFMVGLIRHLHSSDQLIVTSPHPDKRPIILNSLKMIDQIKKRIQFSSFASIPPPPPPPPPPHQKKQTKTQKMAEKFRAGETGNVASRQRISQGGGGRGEGRKGGREEGREGGISTQHPPPPGHLIIIPPPDFISSSERIAQVPARLILKDIKLNGSELMALA